MPEDRAGLEALRWRVRPVLVFAGADGDAAYAAQLADLEAAAEGLAERDVAVLCDPRPAGGGLRRALGVEGFAVILVGKDGGEKLRRRERVAPEALFDAIDAMPMRRREMSGRPPD